MESEIKTIHVAFFSARSYDEHFFSKCAESEEFDDTEFVFDFFENNLTEKTANLSNGHDAVCISENDVITEEIANELVANGVKILALRCTGVKNINLSAIPAQLAVVRIPSYSEHATAEYAVALLQALNRKVHKAYNRVREENFYLDGFVGTEIFGRTVGIIGVGNVGKNLAEIFKGFGAKILLNDSAADQNFANRISAEYINLEGLFKNSDYIFISCPLTQQSRHIINKQCISLMKKDVLIVNVGRSALIDATALLDALVSKRIKGAAFDSYEEEENIDAIDWDEEESLEEFKNKLIQLPNVLFTKHQAYLTQENLEKISLTTLKSIRSIINGESCENQINKQTGN